MARHAHVIGARARDRRPVLAELGGPGAIVVSCHQGLRGPYTGVDHMLAAVLPDAYARYPDLVEFHRLELLDGLPELCDIIGPAPRTLSNDAPFAERTRWYGHGMVRCMSQGIVTFLRAYAGRLHADGGQVPTLVFDDVHAAEVTTQEFLALFVRRVPADVWPVVLGGTGAVGPELDRALTTYAEGRDAGTDPEPEPPAGIDELADAYVDSDATTDDPRALAAYLDLDPADRRARHDRRAAQLRDTASWGVRVAALTLHCERGSDPGGAGVAALLAATQYCTAVGFSSMVVELAERGLAVTDPDADPENYRKLSHLLIAQLISYKRFDDAIRLCGELRRRYALPLVHMTTSYFRAMIYTRFVVPRDHDAAAEWQNNAIVIAGGLPDERQRLVLSGFQENGMALVEMHRGNLVRALELVDGAMSRLDEILQPDEWAVHRSQLLYNQTRLYSAMGRKDEAFDAYTELIALDPHYTDYLSERAKISRRRGDLAAALADYDRAVVIGPPFVELFHNRGSLYVDLGELDRARADFDTVLDMEPDDVDTRLSRAELLLGEGELDAARADITYALELVPDDPRLLCVRGMISLEAGDPAAARADFDTVLALDPDYPAALANRAVAAFQTGAVAVSVADLTRALELAGDDADLLLNRGIAYAADDAPALALADFDHALTLPDADRASLRFQRGACLLGIGKTADAEADLRAALDLGYDREDVLALCASASPRISV